MSQQSSLDQFMLPVGEFLKALQDEGKVDEKTETKLVVFPEINEFPNNFTKKLKEKRFICAIECNSYK